MLGEEYQIDIMGVITGQEDYIKAFDVIRQAVLGDTVTICINSEGGDMATTAEFITLIDNSAATFKAVVNGVAYSAATMIALCCCEVHVGPFSKWMFHATSSGFVQNARTMAAHSAVERWTDDRIFRHCYSAYFYPAEIDDMLNGKELWLTSADMLIRLES